MGFANITPMSAPTQDPTTTPKLLSNIEWGAVTTSPHRKEGSVQIAKIN
jgi:hypothetical protein